MAPLSLLNTWNCLREAQKICHVQRRLAICLLQSIDVLKQDARTKFLRMLKFTAASIDTAVAKLVSFSSFQTAVNCIVLCT